MDLDAAARPPSSAFRRWLAPVTFAVFGLVDIFVLGLNSHHGDATFAFSQPFAKVTVPNLTLPAAITCYVCGAIITRDGRAAGVPAVQYSAGGGWP